MRYASSALVRCTALRSSHGKTATVRMPSSSAARNARTAISPRLATRIVENKGAPGRDGEEAERRGAAPPGPGRSSMGPAGVRARYLPSRALTLARGPGPQVGQREHASGEGLVRQPRAPLLVRDV